MKRVLLLVALCHVSITFDQSPPLKGLYGLQDTMYLSYHWVPDKIRFDRVTPNLSIPRKAAQPMADASHGPRECAPATMNTKLFAVLDFQCCPAVDAVLLRAEIPPGPEVPSTKAIQLASPKTKAAHWSDESALHLAVRSIGTEQLELRRNLGPLLRLNCEVGETQIVGTGYNLGFGGAPFLEETLQSSPKIKNQNQSKV